MPLESCMILLDNSEYMRNGDYIPTRMEAQHDAANLLVGQKTQSNPESTVGVIAMSGGIGSGPSSAPGAELLVSPTDDMGKILSALHGIPTRGPGDDVKSGVDIPASVQVASLALKHRRNKNGAQRIVLFVGSPLGSVESRALQRAGRQLKKNNVAIDIVALGELDQNEDKLRELVDAANGSGGEGGERTCNLVTIPAGVLPSDVLVSSPIVAQSGGGGAAAAAAAPAAGGGGGGGGDAFAEYGGVDPNMDPELAMALRVSMEEERARQERAAAAAAAAEESKEGGGDDAKEGGGEGMEVDADGKPAAAAPADAVPPSGEAAAKEPAVEVTAAAGGTGGVEVDIGMGDEDALLQQALAMSMAESFAPPPAPAEEKAEEEAEAKKPAAAEASEASVEVPMETDEDAAMQMALQMSMQAESDDKAAGGEEAKVGEDVKQQQFQDPQFVNQLLGSLPGVDPNDPAIQSALRNLNQGDKKDGDDKGSSDEKQDGDSK